ncbi:uncharacterized protein N0V89_005994 [Didymosphaeria variabile]|uniref:Ecp2 effector protein domain-containing protein n=1 Tax=Didymosphaeria variabile TaxID=1932322 RepID=A0A9W9CBS9_9PLEO|nr:uncharacterized protein N0V89_005994 [Didymosphaeria variabile]KAJ4354260.1 hypothetical protein N0V89_005994 [Didymosphaeria variabile]
MRPLTFFTFLLHLLLFVSASTVTNEPFTSPTDTDASTADLAGGVYACEGDNFTGDCFYNPPERMRACALLLIGRPDSGVGYHPRSIGPDRGGHCDVFKGRICNDHTFVRRIDYPGVKSYAELNPNAWEAIRCYAVAAQASAHEEIAVELIGRSEIPPKPAVYPSTDDEAASSIGPAVPAGDSQTGGLHY